MSIICNVVLKVADQTKILCHPCDGYPQGVGAELAENYYSEENNE